MFCTPSLVPCVFAMWIFINVSTESISALIPGLPSILGGADNDAADVISSGGDIYYSGLSDFFFQAVFVAAAMSIVSGRSPNA